MDLSRIHSCWHILESHYILFSPDSGLKSYDKPTISCGSRRVFYGVVITQQLRHSNLPMFDSFSFPGDKIPHPDGGVDGCQYSRLEFHPDDVPNNGAKGFGLNGI